MFNSEVNIYIYRNYFYNVYMKIVCIFVFNIRENGYI